MQKTLANGLILRTLSEGVASDRARLPKFYSVINSEGDPEWVRHRLAAWVEDLLDGHPTMTLDDFFVVVDPARDEQIVSATLLIPQMWRYEDVLIPTGRPELVGTHPEYRGRGLVRMLFGAVHERSAALGHLLQGITGIPYFYRQFGYTMALDLGHSATFPLLIPRDPPADYVPKFTLRAATEDDIDDLVRWHAAMAQDRVITEVRSREIWRYELMGRDERSLRMSYYQIIVNAQGEGVGYVELAATAHNPQDVYCPGFVVGEKASYLATFDDVMRGIKQWAIAKIGLCPPLLALAPGNHPALYTLIDQTYGGAYPHLPYKWFVRVPDPLAFFRRIQPVLERRLEGSGAHRYTGEFKIGFYNLTGISLDFKEGKLVDVRAVQGKDGYTVSFPWHLVWNVVLGDHHAAELRAVLPDVDVDADASGGKGAVLLDALFPKKASWFGGLA